MEELVKRLRAAAIMSDALSVFLPHSEGSAVAKLYNEAADAIEDLDFACNRYEKDYKDLCNYLPKWIPVTERLPKDEETVLTWGKQGTILLDWRHDNKWCCFGEATHWMPLPQPPKEEI